MAFISADRVKETTETTGAGAITLAGASAGFRSFASVMSAADTCHYCIVGNNEWEVGLGTYNTTLARTSVIASSNANNLVNFSAGTKDVFITLNQQTILALAAPSSHGHAISDVTNLQTALDAKLDDSQLDTDTTLAANSDTKIATQKAVKAYVDANAGGGSGSITASGYTMATDKLLGRDTASTGAIEELSVGGGLSIASGTLSVSSSGGILSGTSFPISPATNDRFFRSDRGIDYFYDGTRWLSITIFSTTMDGGGGSLATATTQIATTHPFYGQYDIYIEKIQVGCFNTATTATNYFTAQPRYVDAGVNTNLTSSQSFQGVTQSQWIVFSLTSNTVVPSSAEIIETLWTETGAQSAVLAGSFTYRLVG